MSSFKVAKNQATRMVLEAKTSRFLGGVGANFYRQWVFPLYTPRGHQVLQEFPFDHPFHNGVFVGQHPVYIGEKVTNFWAAPPKRSSDDAIFIHVGRMDFAEAPEVHIHERGVRFRFTSVWRDEEESPILDEVRTVDLYLAEGGTVCDMFSMKIASYGPLDFPQTKYGSIGVRVEPRLLPTLGGTVKADGNRHGNVETVFADPETYPDFKRGTPGPTFLKSKFIAYENYVNESERCGILVQGLTPSGANGPWFVRDYGMAMFNPTWSEAISVAPGGNWTVGLRVVAYDGELTDTRAMNWSNLN